MTREEVAAVAAPYGPIEQVEDDASRTVGMAVGFDGIEKFGFTAEEIAAAREALEAVASATRNTVTEYRSLGAPTLSYVDGLLSRVATDHHCAPLNLLGHPAYAGNGLALLAALEAMSGDEALRSGDTVWFPRLGVTAIGFYGDREDGTVGPLDDPADPRIRHLVLEAYEPVSDAPPPVPVTFRGA